MPPVPSINLKHERRFTMDTHQESRNEAAHTSRRNLLKLTGSSIAALG
jgi:hypothetical protein